MTKSKAMDHPITRDEMRQEIHIMSLELSEKLSNRINDTYWKLIPLIMTMQAVIMAIFKWIG